MTKNLLLYILSTTLLILVYAVNAQNYQWTKTFGGSGAFTYNRSMVSDESGNTYIVGEFLGTVDFDPTSNKSLISSAGSTFDVFIQKLDNNGNLLWIKPIEVNWCIIWSLTLDSFGHVILTGGFSDTVDFDPGNGKNIHIAKGSEDIFVLKLDTNGTFIWALTYGGTGTDDASKIYLDTKGFLYLTGTFSNTVDFDPSIITDKRTSNGAYDVFLQKIDSSGKVIWTKTIGGTYYDISKSIIVNSKGDIYVVGYFSGLVDFNSDASIDFHLSTGVSSFDCFIQKLDNSGNYIWTKSFGGKYDEVVSDITIDNLDNIYICGSFEDQVDFNPAAGISQCSANGYRDYFIEKFDDAGNFEWVKTAGGSEYDYAFQLLIDQSTLIKLVGLFQETVEFNSSINDIRTSKGGNDIFIQTLDAQGNIISTITIGGSSNEFLGDISTVGNGTAYITGSFDTGFDFNPGQGEDSIAAMGTGDMFVSKYSDCQNTYNSINVTNCKKYVSPSKKYTWNTSGDYTDTILNKSGCDSIITIHLTIYNNTTTTLTEIACNIFQLNDSIYTSSGVYTQALKDMNGCNNIITLILTIETIDTTVMQFGNSFIALDSTCSYQWLNCNEAFAPIVGANKQSFVGNSNGSYAVILSKSTCVDTSQCYNSTITTIDDLPQNSNITVFPNPTNGVVHIICNHDNGVLSVRNAIGEIVINKNILNVTNSFEIVGPPGLYFLSIQSDEQLWSSKIIKE